MSPTNFRTSEFRWSVLSTLLFQMGSSSLENKGLLPPLPSPFPVKWFPKDKSSFPRTWFTFPRDMVHLPEWNGSPSPRTWFTFPRDMVHLPPGHSSPSPRTWFTFPKDMVHLSQGHGSPSQGHGPPSPRTWFTFPRTWFTFLSKMVHLPQWHGSPSPRTGSPSPRTGSPSPRTWSSFPKDMVHLPHLCMCKILLSTHFQIALMNCCFQGMRSWGTVWIRQFSAWLVHMLASAVGPFSKNIDELLLSKYEMSRDSVK